MRVRDLIEGSTFTGGAARTSPTPPQVSVILPTFRRGDNGMLTRALNSLLGQKFRDLEVIVVDDASTDSTAHVIAAAMQRDPRVSVIRHAHNIGLPAISEYEGYLHARGELISFAFDDTVFHADSIERLVHAHRQAPRALVVGYVTAFGPDTHDGEPVTYEVGKDARVADLLAKNVIANSAVLAPRHILETVGLYDPHVSLSRLCDYDLWRRISRRFPIEFVDVNAGEEYGPAVHDSLGSTYPLDSWLADDRMRQDRDEQLRAEAFGDIDVFSTADFASARSRTVVADIAERHRAQREWMTHLARSPEPDVPASRVPRVLVLAQPIGASVQLIFEGLRDIPDLHVRIMDPNSGSLSELACVDVLVVSRTVAAHEVWIGAAQHAGIPVFFYLDDNLPRMADAGELVPPLSEHYAIDALRDAVAGLDGVITSTSPLAQDFRALRLHARVHAIGINTSRRVAGHLRRQVVHPTPQPTFAIVAGSHRLSHVSRVVWPALVQASQNYGVSIRVLVPETKRGFAGLEPSDESIEVIPFAPSQDYYAALQRVIGLGVDALLVPPSTTVNAEFKTVHPLLTAALLDCSLLVPKVEPYTALEAEQGVTLVPDPDSVGSWVTAIESHLIDWLSGPDSRQAVPESVFAERFDAAHSAEQLRVALDLATVPHETDEGKRQVRLLDWTARELQTRNRYAPSAETRSPTEPRPGFAQLLNDLHRVVRSSRRLHILRSGVTVLSVDVDDLQASTPRQRRTDQWELGSPLAVVPYAEYPVLLNAGVLNSVKVAVVADCAEGDLLGIELVGPKGDIVVNTVAGLARAAEPQWATFDTREFLLPESGTYTVRIFTPLPRWVSVIERVDRGWWRVKRAAAVPLIHCEQ